MPLFIWNQSFSVGIAEIDEQHKVLVNFLNNLHKEMKKGKGKDVIEKTLMEMLEYTIFHFSTEEAYFKKLGYPDAERHIASHNVMRKKVLDFKQRYKEEELRVTIEAMRFLCDWLKNHIKESDKKYAPFLKENGIC